MPESSNVVVAYADGSCLGNPGPGGWGVVIVRPDGTREELNGGEAATTNNKMELTGAIEALRHIAPGSQVVLRSDSQYLVNTMNLRWKRNANLDLWNQLESEVAQRSVKFEWVRGHGDDPLNARADELARAEATRLARGGASSENRRASRAGEDQIADAELAELKSLLNGDETVRKCAGCGRMFVSKRALYCTLVGCQLKARRAAKAITKRSV